MTTQALFDLGTFLGGASALLGTFWGICVFLASRIRKQTQAIIEANSASIHELIKSRMMETIKDMDPSQFYTLDLHFANGLSIIAPMLPDKPLYVSENIQIKVIAHTREGTTLMLTCKGHGYFIPHYHAHTCETIEVREGFMTCGETGVIYRKGDVWRIAAGEMHSAQFQDCVAIVTHKPPLPTGSERPVNLKAVPEIFPL